METKENEIQEYERKNTGNRPDKAVDAKEIDLTDKAKNVIRFGLVGMLAIGLIVSGIVWSMKANSGEVVTNDAKVASVMVGVRSKTAGTITEILVEDGQEVEAGTIVARLKVDVTEEQIKQLENTVEFSKANLEQVKKGTVVTVAAPAPAPAASYQAGGNSADIAGLQRRLDRMNQLLEMGAVSITERDAAAAALAEARAAAVPVAPSAPAATTRIEPASPEAIKNAELAVKQAEMALQAAKTSAQSTEIVANVSGTVFLGDISVDSEVKPGQVIMRIGDATSLWVEAYLPMEKQESARLGQLVSYKIDGKQYKGTVTDIVVPEEKAEGEQPVATEGAAEEQDSDVPKKITVKISIPVEEIANIKPEQRAEVTFE